MMYYIEELGEPVLVRADFSGQTDVGIVRLPEKYHAALLRTLNSSLEETIFSLFMIMRKNEHGREWWAVGAMVDDSHYTLIDCMTSEEEAWAIASLLGYEGKKGKDK